METRLEEIHEYLIKNKKFTKEDLDEYDSASVTLAYEIAEYAHRDQKRLNGDIYINHPYGCMKHYRNLVGIVPGDYFCISKDLLEKYKIPFEGVQEVCLLHDVIEDTDFTFDDIKNIFKENGLSRYYCMYIEKPLKLITHDKSEAYPDYLYKCLTNPISAIVKMCDLQDNLNTLTLDTFDEKNEKKLFFYMDYIYMINRYYKFIENAKKYKDEFREKNKKYQNFFYS